MKQGVADQRLIETTRGAYRDLDFSKSVEDCRVVPTSNELSRNNSYASQLEAARARRAARREEARCLMPPIPIRA